MAKKNYSDETTNNLLAVLLSFLTKNGPSTKQEIKRWTRWPDRLLNHALGSQPDWLVAVGVTRSESKFGRLVLYACDGEHVLGYCKCGRKNFHPSHQHRNECQGCASKKSREINFEFTRIVPGVDVRQPTNARPGSDAKIDILGARLDAKLPLHHPDDDYDSNPGWIKSQEEPDDWDDDE